jgi:hypothetical protein
MVGMPGLWELVRHCICNEAKEVQLDARPQARTSWRWIRLNTLMIFLAKYGADGLRIIRHSKTVNVGLASRA